MLGIEPWVCSCAVGGGLTCVTPLMLPEHLASPTWVSSLARDPPARPHLLLCHQILSRTGGRAFSSKITDKTEQTGTIPASFHSPVAAVRTMIRVKGNFGGGFSSPLSSCFALTCRTSLHYSFSCVDYTIKWQRHVFDICLISMTTDYETRCSEHARRNLRKMMKLNEDLINVKNSNKGGKGKTQQRYFLYGRHVFFYFFYKCIFLSPFCYPNIIE